MSGKIIDIMTPLDTDSYIYCTQYRVVTLSNPRSLSHMRLKGSQNRKLVPPIF